MRETKIITLAGGAKVAVKTGLTWGEKEDLKESLYKGAKLGRGGFEGYDVSAVAEQKYLALETIIVEVEETDGKKHPFSKEWVRGLAIADGDQLITEINAVMKPVTDELKKAAGTGDA